MRGMKWGRNKKSQSISFWAISAELSSAFFTGGSTPSQWSRTIFYSNQSSCESLEVVVAVLWTLYRTWFDSCPRSRTGTRSRRLSRYAWSPALFEPRPKDQWNQHYSKKSDGKFRKGRLLDYHHVHWSSTSAWNPSKKPAERCRLRNNGHAPAWRHEARLPCLLIRRGWSSQSIYSATFRSFKIVSTFTLLQKKRTVKDVNSKVSETENGERSMFTRSSLAGIGGTQYRLSTSP